MSNILLANIRQSNILDFITAKIIYAIVIPLIDEEL